MFATEYMRHFHKKIYAEMKGNFAMTPTTSDSINHKYQKEALSW